MNSEFQAELVETAQRLVSPGKGILAADESSPTLTKRFEKLSIVSNEESRRNWREMLFSAPGLSNWISGTILYDETIRQSVSGGRSFAEFLSDHQIITGIKVDTGAKPLAGHPGETVTEGLDGLTQRVDEYYQMGARFAKWRAVIHIGDGLPTTGCIEANAHALARYAKICQMGGLVPIVEPEVLMDGDHSMEMCYAATERTLQSTFSALRNQRVLLEAMILKPSMVLPAADSPSQASVTEVAQQSVTCYLRNVPASVAGIALLSGGQPEDIATAHLAAMNGLLRLPWPITFSFGRALQDGPMRIWKGQAANSDAAQKALIQLSEANSAASVPNLD